MKLIACLAVFLGIVSCSGDMAESKAVYHPQAKKYDTVDGRMHGVSIRDLPWFSAEIDMLIPGASRGFLAENMVLYDENGKALDRSGQTFPEGMAEYGSAGKEGGSVRSVKNPMPGKIDPVLVMKTALGDAAGQWEALSSKPEGNFHRDFNPEYIFSVPPEKFASMAEILNKKGESEGGYKILFNSDGSAYKVFGVKRPNPRTAFPVSKDLLVWGIRNYFEKKTTMPIFSETNRTFPEGMPGFGPLPENAGTVRKVLRKYGGAQYHVMVMTTVLGDVSGQWATNKDLTGSDEIEKFQARPKSKFLFGDPAKIGVVDVYFNPDGSVYALDEYNPVFKKHRPLRLSENLPEDRAALGKKRIVDGFGK